MYNSNTKVAVCNSVTSKPATTAFASLALRTFSSGVTDNGGNAQSAFILGIVLKLDGL